MILERVTSCDDFDILGRFSSDDHWFVENSCFERERFWLDTDTPLVELSLLRDVFDHSLDSVELFCRVLAIFVHKRFVFAHELRHRLKCAQLRRQKDNLLLPYLKKGLADLQMLAIFLEEVVFNADLLPFSLEEGF